MARSERDDVPMLLERDIEMQIPSKKDRGKGKAVVIPVNTSFFETGGNRGLMGRRPRPSSVPVNGHEDLRKRRNASNLISSGAVSRDPYGEKEDDMYKSEPLGMCNDVYCYHCPASYRARATMTTKTSGATLHRSWVHSILHVIKDWPWKFFASIMSCFPIFHPQRAIVKWWNRFFVIVCFLAIFVDPLFFFVLSANRDDKCMEFSLSLSIVLSIIRTLTDFIYLMHILFQFRLAYVARETRIVGAGDFVSEPKLIAKHYLLSRYFVMDLFAVIPLPQILVLGVLPKNFGTASSRSAKNLLLVAFLFQYIPRIARITSFVAGESANGFIFESAWANFVINLLMFVLTGHVVGSCWYLFGLQTMERNESKEIQRKKRTVFFLFLDIHITRVNQCLKDACNITRDVCKHLIYCEQQRIGVPEDVLNWKGGISFSSADCFDIKKDFNYGIYQQTVEITTEKNLWVQYIYSLFWGFQQISTLAGNLIPSKYVWEVLFTMGIIAVGLLLFALLIGNIQNFLQALGRRRSEMQLRQRDIEQWMSHRRLPLALKNHVREAEQFSWTATRGVNEELLLHSLPENIQKDIRRHLFSFLKKVRIFSQVDDEPIFDFVSKRLRPTLYLRESNIFEKNAPVEKIVFIVRGQVTSTGEDGNQLTLLEGDVCGDELLASYLKHTTLNRDRGKGNFSWRRLRSTSTVTCATNVEAFCLYAADLENVNHQFAWYLRQPRVQGAIRYQSIYSRKNAATRIQREWRLRRRRSNGSTSRSF